MAVQEMQKAVTIVRDADAQAGAGVDPAVLYRRAVITKIRLRQAIFRARHLACGVGQGRLEELQAR